ncbi:hypothetical protein Ancab_025399 [Ancistrocladus abbreviatus]
MAKSSQRAKISSQEVVNPVKRSTVVTEIIAKERTLVYRVVQERGIIKHFSHPHALQEYEFQEQYRMVCDACTLGLSGAAYGCAKCDFYLHKSCFEAPRELVHGAHSKHTLKLHSKTPYSSPGRVICNSCGKEIKSFTYHCIFCIYDLHIDCAHLPMVMKRDDHKHTLTLYHSFPRFKYSSEEQCHVCRNSIDKRRWVYGCHQCKYWCHSDCVFGEAISSSEEEDSSEDELEDDEDDKREANIRTTTRLKCEMSSKLSLYECSPV